MTVPLDTFSFLLQVHNLPVGFMSEKVANLVGNHVGVFEQADKRNFDAVDRAFMMVRTKLNVTKPLKARMKMKKPGGDWFWIDLRYERLPSFCFECGVSGHVDKFCPIAIDKPLCDGDKPFGVWMRAGGRWGGAPPVNKWLVLDEAVDGGSLGVTAGNDGDLMHVG